MTPLGMLDSIRLLETMAVHSDDQDFLSDVKDEISRRISQKSELNSYDTQIVELMIECLQEMDKADLDLPHQNQTLLDLGQQYASLKAKLLSRFRGESLALQEECVSQT